MVMGMNIKSDDTHRRAKELARMAGESLADAVDRAVTERLERLRRRRNRKALAERLMKIGGACSRLPVLDSRAPEEMLYDQHGLPQ
jgi:antitoxin VapB